MFGRRHPDADSVPPPLDGLGPRHWRALAPHVDQVTVDAGTVLARQDQHAHQFVVLLSGHATAESEGRPASAVEAGTWLGATELLDDLPWAETVRTDEPSELLVVNRVAFRSLLHDVPDLDATLRPNAA